MLTYYLLRIGLVLAAVLPRRTGYWLCSVIGNIAFYCNHSARHAVQDNMRHVLGPRVSRRRLNRVSRAVFRNTVKNNYDLLILPRLSMADLEKQVRLDGAEYLEKAMQGKNGVILFTGHIGNFNLVVQMTAARGYPANIIAEAITPPKLYDLVNGLRSRFGLKMIPLGPTAVRGIYHALRANELLGLAADRDLTETGVPVEFFGETTELPGGVAALALRLHTPLLPVHTIRTANDSSVVTVYPPLELPRTGDRDRDALVGTQQIAHILEDMIRKAPEQWVVLQPVWPKKTKEAQRPAEPPLLPTVVDARVPPTPDLAEPPSRSRSA
jgi:lauroyl/myristoyl acyltransferase